MVQLQTKIDEFEAAGIHLVAISYDSSDILKRFAEKNKITFPLLSDPDSKVIEAFHIRNSKAPPKWAGIPHPGTFVIDGKGKIRAKLFLESYRERHPAEDVLEAAEAAESSP